MGVEQRGTRWFIRYTDVSGKRRRRKTFAQTREEAVRLWLDIERKIERQRLGLEPLSLNPEGWTLEHLMTWWLGAHRKKSSSYGRDKSYITRQILADKELAGLPLEHVTPGVIERFLLSKPHLDPNSINHIRDYFSRAFQRGIEIEAWLGANPAHKVKKRRIIKKPVDVLTVDEVPRLLAAATSPWREIFAVALFAGLRKGEIFGLRADDVDLEHDLLWVRRSHDRETTKSGKARVVPIHPQLRAHLKDALAARGSSAWLFPAGDGGQLHDRHKVCLRLATALSAAGFIRAYTWKCRRKGCGYREEEVATQEARPCPRCNFKLFEVRLPRKLRFHDLRHTAATLYLQAGADIVAVQRILGHSSPVITTETYGHLAQGYVRAQMLKLSVDGVEIVDARAVAGDVDRGAIVINFADERARLRPDRE
jgi:integrase